MFTETSNTLVRRVCTDTIVQQLNNNNEKPMDARELNRWCFLTAEYNAHELIHNLQEYTLFVVTSNNSALPIFQREFRVCKSDDI